MPWKVETSMSLRREFVGRARQEGANISQLCRGYGISRKTGYKWLGRYAAEGVEGLDERSRRPQRSPRQTPPEIEALVVAARQAHPAWGGRKLKSWLTGQGYAGLPAPSTITAILERQGLIDPAEACQHQPYQRFEMSRPNELWQMDFKGPLRLGNGQVCHPLTVLDDYSRFLVGLRACADEKGVTVQHELTRLFRLYGLPERMLMDNGAPWGDDAETRYTWLTVWLLRLGIGVSHGRPYHPQTQGKDERLHRTLEVALLVDLLVVDLLGCQGQFDPWRDVYNLERPHEALDLQPPATRYQSSPRPFPETLPPLVYPADLCVRKVDSSGKLSFRGQPYRVGRAFAGLPVGLRFDDLTDGRVLVFLGEHVVRLLDLHTASC
jgi:transposase InsO family protein